VSAAAASAQLIEAASARYRAAGRFAWYFARGKLAGDPIYASILTRGLLTGCSRVLDLGCGQGLLAAWLMAAQRRYDQGHLWPPDWPPPPLLSSYRGIEINPREVTRARRALDSDAAVHIVQGDIADVDYGSADAVVILDVLHFIDHSAQERVLERVRATLGTTGVLLLRVGDADGGAGFALSVLWDRAVVLARRGRWMQLQCRPLREWQALLGRLGFAAQVLPMSHGTPFTNALLVARAR
jgi:SAM-dependent methyltransferase